MQTQIKSKYNKLQDTFQYYRLAVYTYSLATLLEITLRGKFDDEYISINKSDLESLENQYREMFEKCSRYIEHLGNVSVEKNIINGVGILGKSAGKTIGSIPLINKGTVDELLIDGGKLLQDNARSLKQRYVHAFSKMNNPGVNVVMEQMKTLDNLYSNNSSIYIDKENVYLVSE